MRSRYGTTEPESKRQLKRSCSVVGETERTELLRHESEEDDAQFNSSDEVADNDSEIVVSSQGRERLLTS